MAVVNGRLAVDPELRPHYTLAELLAEASGAYPLPVEEREWIDTTPPRRSWFSSAAASMRPRH